MNPPALTQCSHGGFPATMLELIRKLRMMSSFKVMRAGTGIWVDPTWVSAAGDKDKKVPLDATDAR